MADCRAIATVVPFKGRSSLPSCIKSYLAIDEGVGFRSKVGCLLVLCVQASGLRKKTSCRYSSSFLNGRWLRGTCC